MTNEQREAIEDVEEFNNKFDCGKYRKSIDTVVSLIKEQQEEIEKYKSMIIEHKKQLKQSGIYGYDYDLKID